MPDLKTVGTKFAFATKLLFRDHDSVICQCVVSIDRNAGRAGMRARALYGITDYRRPEHRDNLNGPT